MSDTNIVPIDNTFRPEKSTQTANRTNNDLLQLICLASVEIGMLEKRDSHAKSFLTICLSVLYDVWKGNPQHETIQIDGTILPSCMGS